MVAIWFLATRLIVLAAKQFYHRLYGTSRRATEYQLFSSVGGDWKFPKLVGARYRGLNVFKRGRFAPYGKYDWTSEYSYNLASSAVVDAQFGWSPLVSDLRLGFFSDWAKRSLMEGWRGVTRYRLDLSDVPEKEVYWGEGFFGGAMYVRAPGIEYHYALLFFNGSSVLVNEFEGSLVYDEFLRQKTVKITFSCGFDGGRFYLIPEEGFPLSVYDPELSLRRNMLYQKQVPRFDRWEGSGVSLGGVYA